MSVSSRPSWRERAAFRLICCSSGVEIGEPLFGGLIGRFLVCPLKFPTPCFLVGLRQVADYVLALMPLATLDLGALAEDLIDCLAQSFAPVDDSKNALLEGEPSFN